MALLQGENHVYSKWPPGLTYMTLWLLVFVRIPTSPPVRLAAGQEQCAREEAAGGSRTGHISSVCRSEIPHQNACRAAGREQRVQEMAGGVHVYGGGSKGAPAADERAARHAAHRGHLRAPRLCAQGRVLQQRPPQLDEVNKPLSGGVVSGGPAATGAGSAAPGANAVAAPAAGACADNSGHWRARRLRSSARPVHYELQPAAAARALVPAVDRSRCSAESAPNTVWWHARSFCWLQQNIWRAHPRCRVAAVVALASRLALERPHRGCADAAGWRQGHSKLLTV